jgi:hypothetical protein
MNGVMLGDQKMLCNPCFKGVADGWVLEPAKKCRLISPVFVLFVLLSFLAANRKHSCETRLLLLSFMKWLHLKGADALMNPR